MGVSGYTCLNECVYMGVMFIVCENTYENESASILRCVLSSLFFVFIFQNVFIMSMHFFLIRDNHKIFLREKITFVHTEHCTGKEA